MADLLLNPAAAKRKQILLDSGLDPARFSFDEFGNVTRAEQSSQSPATQDSPSLQITAKPTPLGSFGRQAAAGVLPAAGGLLAGSLAAAPFTGGTSLLLPLGAGVLGAIAGGYGTAKAQEALLPDSVNETLARDLEVNPKSSMAGNVASSLLFLKPDFKSVANAAQGLRNVATGGATKLSAPQAGNLLNVGLGAGLGAGSSAYDDLSQDKDIDLGKLLISAAGNAIINNPNKLGQKAFRLTPNTYDVAGEAQTRAKMAGDETTLSQEALNQRASQAAMEAQIKAEQDAALLETASKKYQKMAKEGRITAEQAAFLTQEDLGIAQRKATKAAGKKMEPSVKEELSEFGKQEASYDEMYSKYGDVLAQQEPTPKLRLEETSKLVDNELARQSEELKLEEFKTRSAEIEAQKLELQQRQADLEEATTYKVTPKPPATSEEVLGTTAVTPPTKPTVAPEAKPMVEPPRQQTQVDPTLTEAQREAIVNEKENLLATAKEQGKSLEPTVGFRDAMTDLAEKRGVKLEYDNTIDGAGETLSRESQIKARKLLQTVVSKINPDKAGMDTWPHELIHPLITDMETGASKSGRELAAKVKAAAGGSEELVTDLSGKEVISRLLDLRKESGGKKLYRDFAAFVKTKYGNPSLDDVKRLMANRVLNEVPYSELSPEVKRSVGVKAGEEAGEVVEEGEAVRAQDAAQVNVNKEAAAPKFDDMRRAAGATEEEIKNKQTVEAKDLKAAKFAGRKQEGELAAKADNRVFVTDFEKSLTTGDSPVAKLRVNKEGKLDSNEVLGQMTKFNPGEVQLLKEAGIEQFLKSNPKVTKEELAKWVKDNGPKVEVVEYGQKGKVSAAAEEYANLQHLYDSLEQRTQADIEGYNNNKDYPEIQDKIFKRIKQSAPGVKREELDYFLDLKKRVALEPVDTSPRATSAYNSVSPKDPKKFPIQRVDVVMPLKKLSFEEWLKSGNMRDTPTTRKAYEDEGKGYIRKDITESPKWKPDNLHENLPNTLGWAAIQYETLPSGEKVAHLFEVQSRWGQAMRERAKNWGVRKTEDGWQSYSKEGNTIEPLDTFADEATARRHVEMLMGDNNSPLLKDYNRLILKAAIDEARKNGATKIAISDAETAMMTEGHDAIADHIQPVTKDQVWHAIRNSYEPRKTLEEWYGKDWEQGKYVKYSQASRPVRIDKPEANASEILRQYARELQPYAKGGTKIPQEPGMRFNYDTALPRIAEELTGSKGEVVEFGKHKNAYEGKMDLGATGAGGGVVTRPTNKLRDNLIFKNADGSPKTSVTARAYDISFPAARRSAGEPYTMFGKRYQSADTALPRQQAADNLTSEPRTASEIRDVVGEEQPMKLGILDFMLGQADKVKKVDQQLGEAFENFFARKSYYEGKYGNTIQKVVTTAPREVRERVGKYMVALDAGKPAPYTLTGEEKALHSEIQSYLKGVREDQNRLKIRVSGYRKGEFNENYLPNIIDREVINTLINKGNTSEAAALRSAWNSHIVKESKGKLSLKEAAKITNDYIRAIGNEKLSGQLEFGAIRKAEGYGLPEALQEKDLASRLSRYGNRVAKDFAYYEELQNVPEVAAKLGLKDQKGKQILVEGIESSKYAHEDVKKAIKMVGETGDNYHPITNSFNRVVTNALLGPLSGLRDVVSIPAHTIPYLNKLEDFGAFVKVIPKLGKAWKDSLKSGARRENLDSLLFGESGNSGNFAADKLNQLAKTLRVLQGREFLEQGARAYTYAIGEELTRANIARAAAGDKESLAWLKKFGGIVDSTDFSSPAALRNLTPEDITKLAKGFVDRVQGSYDGRNLPLGIMEGPAAPFFALSRWSVEKANVIRKDVLEPLARGNVKPFLMYSLGSLVTGAVVEKLAEEVNGRRAADPTLKEAFANSQADTEDQVGYAIKALQLGSFAGILSDVVKAGWDVKEGKVPKGFSYPAADFVANTLGQNLSDMMQAIREGEDPSKTLALFVEQVAKNSIQGVRIVNNQFINPEEAERSEKFRDKAVFETMTDVKQPTSFGTSARSNPYTDVDYKEFKRADTVEETIPALKKAIATAVSKANGDPLNLKNELSNLKRNSFQTMPNPKTMPQEFLKYVLFLRETQGEEAAAERVQEYLRMQSLNRAKSAAIP